MSTNRRLHVREDCTVESVHSLLDQRSDLCIVQIWRSQGELEQLVYGQRGYVAYSPKVYVYSSSLPALPPRFATLG